MLISALSTSLSHLCSLCKGKKFAVILGFALIFYILHVAATVT